MFQKITCPTCQSEFFPKPKKTIAAPPSAPRPIKNVVYDPIGDASEGNSAAFNSCPTCRKEISKTAIACPGCGHVFKQPGAINFKDPVHIVGLIVCLVIIVVVVLHIKNMTVGP